MIRDEPYPLKVFHDAAEFRNSGGRLLCLIERLTRQPVDVPVLDVITGLYDVPNASPYLKGHLFLRFMPILDDAYAEFLRDMENTDGIPDKTRMIIHDGLESLNQIVQPTDFETGVPRPTDKEIGMLRMAASLIPEEKEFTEDLQEQIRNSTDVLAAEIDGDDFPDSARDVFRSVIRVTCHAIDQQPILGARGLRSAFRKTLAELVIVYLDHDAEELLSKAWWQRAFEHVKLVDHVAADLMNSEPLVGRFAKWFSDDSVNTSIVSGKHVQSAGFRDS